MDDDYDNYVPQISTMDWQNLGRDTDDNQIINESSSTSSIGQSSSRPFIYEYGTNVVNRQPISEASLQYQRSYPNMNITPVQSFVGVVGPSQSYHPNNFSSVGQSQMLDQTQQHQVVHGGYISGEHLRQNMTQQGAVISTPSAKPAKTRATKKGKKAALDGSRVNQQLTQQQEPQHSKLLQTNQQQINTNMVYYNANRGIAPSVAQASHNQSHHSGMSMNFPSSENYAMQQNNELMGRQLPFQQRMFNPASIEQSQQQQNYGPLQHLQSHYGQNVFREQQQQQFVSAPQTQQGFGQYQQKYLQPTSIHSGATIHQQSVNANINMQQQQHLQTGGSQQLQPNDSFPSATGYIQTGYAANTKALRAQNQMIAADGSVPRQDNIPTYNQQQSYHQNPYIVRQQQQKQLLYHELFDCDQQIAILMPQMNQNPEVSIRMERIQMRRQYLHAQLMQINYAAANTSMATTIASETSQIGTGTVQSSDLQQSTNSNSFMSPQSGGQFQQHYGKGGLNFPVGHQQKLIQQQPNLYSYPQQQNFVQNQQVISQQYHHPTPPIPSIDMTQQQQQQQQINSPQQQQYMPPLPSMSSPSVAVMSASNQVQVNIRPELPGRTLISVYHGQDLQSNITQPAMSTYDTSTQKLQNYEQQGQYRVVHQDHTAKDSIPPEPLPPNLSREHKLRQQQQKLQQQENILQFKKPEPVQNFNSEELETCLPSPPSPPIVSTSVNLCFFACDELMANCMKVFSIHHYEMVNLTIQASMPVSSIISTETVLQTSTNYVDALEIDNSLNQNLEKSDEHLNESMDDKQLKEDSNDDEKSCVIADDVFIQDEQQTQLSLIDEGNIDECSDVILNNQQQKRGIKRRYDDDILTKEEDDQNVAALGNLQEEEEVETTFEIKTDCELVVESISEQLLEDKNKKVEKSIEDVLECSSNTIISTTKETTPPPIDNFPFALQNKFIDNSFASTSNTKTTKSRRKKRKMDWNKPHDDDYISTIRGDKKLQINKRSTKRKKSSSSVTADDETTFIDDNDNEFLFNEKRLSRKRTIGKKKQYEEMMSDNEDLNKLIEEKEIDGRIVERILGVRLTKRMILKDDVEEKKIDEKLDKDETVETKDLSKVNEDNKAEDKEVLSPSELTISKEMDIDEQQSIPIENEIVTKEETTLNLQINTNSAEPQLIEEVYVKFKGFSYLHCEWKTIQELEELGDKRVAAKLNRWKQKYGNSNDSAIVVTPEDDDEQHDDYFNEDYTIVSRVLDETYDKKENQQYVFVKWKALPYEESTWELEQDVPLQKILDFRLRSEFDLFKLKEQPKISPKEFTSRLAIPKDKLYNNDNVLREYQHEGVNWLLWTWLNNRNCILADEMGLGKTVQSIVFLLSLYDIGVHGPFLIVVPLSTLGNWEREFHEWAPEINAIVYHGGAVSRKIIRDYEFFYKKADGRRRNVPKFDALITTYEVVVQEVEVLRRINFRVCVIDEAHRIKNRNCKLLQSGLLSLRMNHRVLLTGTPLQNNIQELFSLLNFLEPDQFANSEAFLKQFGQCQTEEQVQKLQEILKPMMLRRLKEDVEKELQPKEETIIEVQLSNIQKKYYRAVLERNFTHLMKGTTPSLINTMMQLRKCCCHPYLINGAEEQILDELKQLYPEKTEEELQIIGLISSSGKVVLIDKLLPKLRADGHRVLLFSQMVRVLDLLEEYFIIKGYPFERIDGNIRGNERQAAIDRFSKPENKDCFIFLLCTRAGGLGINLTAADTVIIFDSDWNPQNDLQAQARCHRIGQTKQVKIYRLITANTYEREMFDKASLKLGLDKAVLQSMRTECNLHNTHQLTRQEVEDLLRKGAYGAIMDEDNEGAKFGEEDIDTILERRAQTIRLEPGVKGSTFAKASFTFSHNRDDIDVSDPDFWSKWAKKANIDVVALHDDFSSKHLIMHEPRTRKKRFDVDKNFESGDDGISDEEEHHIKGVSRIAENVKSRSMRKKRRSVGLASAPGTEDDNPDEEHNQGDERSKLTTSRHPELSCTITQLKKVEKLLMQWGWGKWSTLKQFSELSEHELEHISRTLLLHCIREFRGDKKTQEFIWNLITPPDCSSNKNEEKEGDPVSNDNETKVIAGDLKSKFYQGWAQKPEYNPPFICVDMTFQRHLHRNANKLLNRIQSLENVDNITQSKESLTTKQSVDIEIQSTSKTNNPIGLSTSVINSGSSSTIDFKHQIPIKTTSERRETTTRTKDVKPKQTNCSILTKSEVSTPINNKSSFFGQSELNKMMSNPDYMLQLLALMGYNTDASSSLGINSLSNSFTSASPPVSTSSSSNNYSATLNKQLQTLLALTSLSSSSTTDLNTSLNSSLMTALSSLIGTTGTSNVSKAATTCSNDGSVFGKSHNIKKMEIRNLAIQQSKESSKQMDTAGKQNVASTTISSTNQLQSDKSTTFNNNKSSLIGNQSEYSKMMNNPEYMLQLLTMMGYGLDTSKNLGINSIINSLISPSPSSSSSSSYSTSLQNQQLQTLLSLSSLCGSGSTNDLMTNSYLTAALASMGNTNTNSSFNIGSSQLSKTAMSGLNNSIWGKTDNSKKLTSRDFIPRSKESSLTSKQPEVVKHNVSTTPSSTTSATNKSLFGQNEYTKMMNNPEYLLQLLALMGYGSTETTCSSTTNLGGINSFMNLLNPSSSTTASTSSSSSTSYSNQQLQTLLALSSLSGVGTTTDLNNITNSSAYLNTLLSSLVGSSSSSSTGGSSFNSAAQGRQETTTTNDDKTQTTTGQKKINKSNNKDDSK